MCHQAAGRPCKTRITYILEPQPGVHSSAQTIEQRCSQVSLALRTWSGCTGRPLGRPGPAPASAAWPAQKKGFEQRPELYGPYFPRQGTQPDCRGARLIIVPMTAAHCSLACDNDPGRTRAYNPRLRRPMPYPLGHGACACWHAPKKCCSTCSAAGTCCQDRAGSVG